MAIKPGSEVGGVVRGITIEDIVDVPWAGQGRKDVCVAVILSLTTIRVLFAIGALKYLGRVNTVEGRKREDANQVPTPSGRVIRTVGRFNRRVVYRRVVRVRLCIGDVPRVLGDGILEEPEGMSAPLIAQPLVAREGTYCETVSDTQHFEVNGNTREGSCSNGGVLIEEVSRTT